MNRAYTLGTMRTFKTKNFTVRCTAEEELDVDLSFDDTGEVREGLGSGKYMVFRAKVAVYFKGEEIGTDYLGNCIYESLDDFMDHRECGKINKEYEAKGKATRCGSYFHDMIREAIREARKTIQRKRQEYKNVRIRKVA
jgi:hypothetical protein